MNPRVEEEWRKPKEETRYSNEPDGDILGDRDWFDLMGGRPIGGPRQPLTEFEALLQCAPHEEPALSYAESHLLREAVGAAVEALPPRERWVFDALFTERKSLRAVAREIGYSKSQVANIRDRALTALRATLSHNLLVRRYLNGRAH